MISQKKDAYKDETQSPSLTSTEKGTQGTALDANQVPRKVFGTANINRELLHSGKRENSLEPQCRGREEEEGERLHKIREAGNKHLVNGKRRTRARFEYQHTQTSWRCSVSASGGHLWRPVRGGQFCPTLEGAPRGKPEQENDVLGKSG